LNATENTRADSKGQWTFVRLASAAVLDRSLSAECVRTLAAFALYADAKGFCRPAVGTVANILGVSRRAVQLNMRRLEASGYLATVRTQREKGGFGANDYQLRFPAAATPGNPSAGSDADADPNEGSAFEAASLESDGSPIERDAKPGFASTETSETDAKPGFTSDERCEAGLQGGAKPGFRRGAKPGFARTIPMNDTKEREDTPLPPTEGELLTKTPFEELVESDPKAYQTQLAKSAWEKAVRSGIDPDAIIDARRQHLAGTEPRYVEQLHKFIAREGWKRPVMAHSAGGANRSTGFDALAWAEGA
jgi:hypothetical protein